MLSDAKHRAQFHFLLLNIPKQGTAGLLSVPDDLLATSFDLNDLDEHNFPIEHDASLSRADYYENNGDNYSFNQSIFDTVLSYYAGMSHTSIPVAAAAK